MSGYAFYLNLMWMAEPEYEISLLLGTSGSGGYLIGLKYIHDGLGHAPILC